MSPLLEFGIFLLVTALGTSAVVLLRDVTTQKLVDRLTSIRPPEERSHAQAVTSIRRIRKVQAPWQTRLSKIVAFDPSNSNQYFIPWPIVLLCGGLVGAGDYWVASGVGGSVVGSASAICAGLFAARSLFRFQRVRYAERLLRQLPDAIGMIVRGASVGQPVAEAVRVIAGEAPEPIATEFSRVSREVAVGNDLEESLADIYHRTGLSEFSFLAVAVSLQQRSGGSTSDALNNLADIVRKRIGMVARAKALSGEARLSIMILGGLPFGAGLLLSLESWSYMAPLFYSPTGAKLQRGFVLLFMMGLVVMRWLMRRATRI